MVMAKKYNSVQGKLRKGGGKGLSGDALVGRVSQATIDSIKKMGMTEALKLAGKNGKTSGGMAREFQEGVRRMYGAKRLEAAKTKYAPKPKLGEKTVMAPKGGNKPAAKPASKGSSAATKAKVIGGTVAAIGLAVKGGPAGRKAATKLAPALAKSRVGKALLGSEAKLSPSSMAKFKAAQAAKAAPAKVTVGPKGSFGKTTLTKAKSGLGTASEYASKAGQESARAAIKAKSPDAARAAATTTKKAAVSVSKKKVVKAGMASTGAGQTKK
jgi:hypothetical protein